MASKKQRKSFSKTWLGRRQPFKFIFGSLPSIKRSERRWAFFQVILSLVFFFVAVAIGLLTIDMAKVSRDIMIIAIFLFALGCLGLIYAIGIGIYWTRLEKTPNRDAEEERAEEKRIERDNRLHEDIQGLIKQLNGFTEDIRRDRDERNRKTE